MKRDSSALAQPPAARAGSSKRTWHARPLPFSGNPRRYRLIAIAMTVAIHVYLYAGMMLITYGGHGERWMLGWKPLTLALASMAAFGRFAYVWMMRLDAQYGTGAGWRLVRRRVKLPEPRSTADVALDYDSELTETRGE